MQHFALAILFILALTCTAQEPTVITDDVGNVFHLTTLTDKVPSARQMALTKSGMLFVGSRGPGNLYAVIPADSEGSEPEVVTFASGLTMPTGLALHGEDLYVAALNRILKYPNIEQRFRENPEPEVVIDTLPRARHHGWKYLSVGPDESLYFNVGAPCNICLSDDEIFASIVRLDPSNKELEIYAHGVRNSVGIDWHPGTNQMWFSDNGRDMWGDDRPPEEINVVEKPGSHFGYPFLHGENLVDPQFGNQRQEDVDYITPVVNIQAHAAALGLDFYTAQAFPAIYENALFIAEHGSWNRSSKVGYRVSVVRFDGDEPNYAPFVDIWLEGQRASARPNDVLVDLDGSLLISDDFRGAIYKVVYVPETDV